MLAVAQPAMWMSSPAAKGLPSLDTLTAALLMQRRRRACHIYCLHLQRPHRRCRQSGRRRCSVQPHPARRCPGPGPVQLHRWHARQAGQGRRHRQGRRQPHRSDRQQRARGHHRARRRRAAIRRRHQRRAHSGPDRPSPAARAPSAPPSPSTARAHWSAPSARPRRGSLTQDAGPGSKADKSAPRPAPPRRLFLRPLAYPPPSSPPRGSRS